MLFQPYHAVSAIFKGFRITFNSLRPNDACVRQRRHQAIISTNAGLLLINWTFGENFSEI